MASQQEDHETQTQTTMDRLNTIPVYAMTLSSLQNAYSSLKERNDVLKGTFERGEQYMQTITNAAKPVVMAATNKALEVVKPVVGEDPVGSLDCVASETLAKVQEKFPLINETPSTIVSTAKATANTCAYVLQDKASSYAHALQGTKPVKVASEKLDGAVAISELMVEMCFPTDASDPADMVELEQEEQDEDKGVLVRASNLRDRTERRGKKKLQTYKVVQVGMDAAHYAQEKVQQISQAVHESTSYTALGQAAISQAIQQSTSYISSKVHGTSAPADERTEAESADAVEATPIPTDGGIWEHVYNTTMYVPNKAIQVSGQVFVSAKEMVFSYSKVHSVREMPHAIVDMSDKYYQQLKTNQPVVASIEKKAVAFVLVPAQVVSHYIANNLPIQWILPSGLQTQSISFVEGEEMDEINGAPSQSATH